MTEERAFKDALVRIGFNALIAEKIIVNGFNKIEILGDVEEREIGELVCHILRWRPYSIPLVDTGGITIAPVLMQITLPFLSIGKLKVMCYWVLKRQRQGRPILAADFVNSEVKGMFSRMKFLESLVQSSESSALQMPSP